MASGRSTVANKIDISTVGQPIKHMVQFVVYDVVVQALAVKPFTVFRNRFLAGGDDILGLGSFHVAVGIPKHGPTANVNVVVGGLVPVLVDDYNHGLLGDKARRQFLFP